VARQVRAAPSVTLRTVIAKSTGLAHVEAAVAVAIVPLVPLSVIVFAMCAIVGALTVRRNSSTQCAPPEKMSSWNGILGAVREWLSSSETR
jgi:hypothetical protein